MKLYTIVYVKSGHEELSQMVIASSVQSAVRIFKKRHPMSDIMSVSVTDALITYEEEDETKKTEGS